MKGRILLVNTDTCPFTKVYPIGLDYLASVLKENGYEVDTLDLAFVNTSKALRIFEKKLHKNEYLAIGIGIRNLHDEIFNGKNYLKEIVHLIKKVKSLININNKKTKIILGGSGFSLMPKTILDLAKADYGIVGEGETALLRILKGVKDKDPLSRIYFGSTDISKILYRRGSWENLHGYFKNFSSGNIQTKRGCPMNCYYCEYPLIEGKRFRFRDPKIVAREFLQLENLGFEKIYIVDATFNNPLYQAKEILKAFKKAKTSRPWTGFLNPLFIDQELINLIKTTNGTMPLKFTIESGSDLILKKLNKSFTRSAIEKAVALCKKNNVDFSFTVLLGGPGETKVTVKETCDLIRKAKPTHVSMSIGIFIHPQTPISQDTYKKLWREEKDFINPIIYPCKREEIKKWVENDLSSSDIKFNIYEGED